MDKVSVFIILIILGVAGFFIFRDNTVYEVSTGDIADEGYLEKGGVKIVYLEFYDANSSCDLNGNLFVNDDFLGEVEDGSFELDFYGNITMDDVFALSGVLGSCFGKEKGVPFFLEWSVPNLLHEQRYEFISEGGFRWPKYPEAMQGFIRPEDTFQKYLTIDLTDADDEWGVIDKLSGYSYMNYVTDNGKFGEPEYWQLPKEFVYNRAGDCEDWAVYMVSLFRNYEPKPDCYLAIWLTHANVVCNIDSKFMIIDQEKVEKDVVLYSDYTEQENKVRIRKWMNSYFDAYFTLIPGIGPSDRKLFYLINEDEIIEFEDTPNDFYEWMLDRTYNQ